MSLGFFDAAGYERFAGLAAETFRQVSDRTGIPLELLTVIREAIGMAQPSPDDRLREDELAIVPFIELQVSEGFRPAAIERLLRVQGDSTRRIAEQEAAWWTSEVIEPAMAAGKGAEEIADADLTDRITPLIEQTFLAMYHAQQARAWTANIIEGFEALMAKAGIHSRLERLPAICFLDITGYTRLTQERGDDAAADLATTVARLVQRSSVQHGGKPIKWLGDGVMFYFRDPGPGRARRPRDGGRAGGRRAAAGACRPARGAGPLPGGRLLRPDREPHRAHRRLRAARRGARQPGGGRRLEGGGDRVRGRRRRWSSRASPEPCTCCGPTSPDGSRAAASISIVPDVRVVPFLVSEVRLPPDEQELLRREWWPSYAHAVIHRDGVFLFDNGAGFGNAEVESTFTPRVTAIEDALAAHGISLADVTGAANCHLHFDHSGQNVRIPRACRSSSSAPSGRRCTNPTTPSRSGSTRRA